MKTLITLILLFIGFQSQAQLTLNSMNGIEMDMYHTKIEKLTGNKIGVKDDWTPVSIKIKGAEIKIIFHTLTDKNRIVYRMSSTSPQLKTAEGIGIGSSLQDILNAYSNSGYVVIKNRNFLDEGEEKADQLAYLHSKRPDDDGYCNYLCFCLMKGKVAKIIVGRTED